MYQRLLELESLLKCLSCRNTHKDELTVIKLHFVCHCPWSKLLFIALIALTLLHIVTNSSNRHSRRIREVPSEEKLDLLLLIMK